MRFIFRWWNVILVDLGGFISHSGSFLPVITLFVSEASRVSIYLGRCIHLHFSSPQLGFFCYPLVTGRRSTSSYGLTEQKNSTSLQSPRWWQCCCWWWWRWRWRRQDEELKKWEGTIETIFYLQRCNFGLAGVNGCLVGCNRDLRDKGRKQCLSKIQGRIQLLTHWFIQPTY